MELCLELVEEVVKTWNTFLETLTLSGVEDNLGGLGSGIQWVSGQDLPMIEDALRESLTTSVGTQVSGET